MGACMNNSHRRGPGVISIGGTIIPRRLAFKKQQDVNGSQILFSQEQSMLLDMWNEKHIEMLKTLFNQAVGKKQTNCLDYEGFLRVFDHSKKEGHQKGASILQTFGPTICKQAFRLFDSSRIGTIIFRDFCCALSIISLGGSNEKARFLFDLFDLDRDGYLSSKELTLLLTQVISSWLCPDTVTKASNRLRQQWVDFQLSSVQIPSDYKGLDFTWFMQWAEAQIDIYKVLSVFELVPSPWREHDIIQQVLDTNQRKHGETVYVLSYRWWDSWKEYTEKHASTLEYLDFVNNVRENIAQNPAMPIELKKQLLFITESEDQPGGVSTKLSHNINGALEKQQWASQEQTPVRDGDAQSFSIGQQRALAYRRTSTYQKSTILVPTPRKSFSIKVSQTNILVQGDDQDVQVSGEDMDQSRTQAPMQSQIPKSQLLARDAPKRKSTFAKPFSNRPSVVVQVSEDSEHSSEDFERDEDVVLQMNESTVPKKLSQSTQQKDLTKLKFAHKKPRTLLNPPPVAQSIARSKSISIDSKSFIASNISARQGNFEDSTRLIENLSNFGKRPLPIDNSDIEGEHPGQLQDNLIMYRDFVTIPEQVWYLFCQWYGQAHQSPVFSRKVLMHNSIASVELYPPRILCVLADRDGKPIADSQRALFVSTHLNMGEVHLKICELFNYISTRDTRLWVKGISQQETANNEWSLVQNSYMVKDSDVFMVEVKFYGNQWPMDDKTSTQRSWQQFEIGDKLDVRDGEVWKIGCIDKVLKDTLRIHLVNENYKNDLTIRKDSDLLSQFGQHTLSLHFKDSRVLMQNKVQGIKNIGNTCYMNACLQILLHTPLFSNYFTTPAFKSFLYANAGNEMISEAFALLIKQKSQVLEPNHFKQALNTSLPLFYGNHQQDAAEFFNFMLDKMNEEMNRADKNSKGYQSLPQPNTVVVATTEHESNTTQGKNSEETGEVGGTSSKIAKVQEESKVQQSAEDINTLKIQLQQKAINDAKKIVYDEFFYKTQNQNKSRSNQTQLSEEQSSVKSVVTDSMNAHLSDLEGKARSAWFQSLQQANSPASDLFVGQQTTEVTCLACQNKSYTFENFYSLPIPLPANNNTCFYINILRWQRQNRQHTKIVAYGIQLQKYLRLVNLVDEIKQMVGVPDSQFLVCEMGQNRIYRVHEDQQTPLYFIAKRTNTLYFYEYCPEIEQIPTSRQKPQSKGNFFQSFEEIQIGMMVDAMDQYLKWYVALVIDKEPASQTVPARVCVYFYQLHQKFDLWFEESPENLRRVRPLMASGRAEQPKDLYVKMLMMHRKANSEDQLFQTSIGLPYCVAIPNWFTWKQFMKEISLQVSRHLQMQDVPIPDENMVIEGHQYLSNKPVDSQLKKRLETHTQVSPNILNFKTSHTDKRLLEPLNKKYQRMQSNNAKLLSVVPDDLCEKYFRIKLFCAETNKCALCLLKIACKQEHEICKDGCALVMSNDQQIKYTFSMFKQLTIVVDWFDKPDGVSYFQDVQITYESSYLKYKKQESEVICGTPLEKCLNLFIKKEKILDYRCDSCKQSTSAVIKPVISHLPDVLVLHLKRFNFISGYLDKIEDLVTFPLHNLDMSKYLIQGARPQANNQYDLYAVVNHHMYQTGGHYTAFVQVKTEQEPIWVLTNDALVTQIDSLKDIVNKDAYMLFYKRKELTPSNIIKLTHQL